MKVSRWFARSAAGALAVLVPGACSRTDQDVLGEDTYGVIFLAQNVIPSAVMDALYEGRIVADEGGCLRMESGGERVTVVWPKDFTLDRRGGELFVRDAAGRDVGQIGGHFRLGGGQVPFLHDGIGLAAADRARAASRCPGIFWITA